MNGDHTREARLLPDGPDDTNLVFLRSLAKRYRSIDEVVARIAHVRAVLTLPKGTIHVVSDVHGEFKKLKHIINNASGTLRPLVDEVFGEKLNDAERQKRGLDRMDATEDKLRQSERKAEENAARAANDPGRASKDASSPTAPKRAPLAAGDPDPAPKGPGGKPRNNEARAPKAPPEPIDLKAKLVEQRERQSRADKRRAERKSAPLPPPPDAP